MADQNLDQLKQKYASVLDLIKQSGVKLAHVHIQDNKLLIQGEAPSEDAKNKVWDKIKQVDPSYADLTVDITVAPGGAATAGSHVPEHAGAAAAGGMQSYTVKSGDTLSKISQQYYGSAGQYMKIFEANKDQLSDPNKIQPGQVLKIPK